MLKRFGLIVLAFFALYAFTAQRGLGWGDSGEFQYRILSLGWEALSTGCDSLATAHPLYVLIGKLVSTSPWTVNLISAFFGALAIGGFYLCTRNSALSVLFGFSHGVWWLSCVAEVYTFSLTFLIFEVFFFKRYLESRRPLDLALVFFLNGLHLCVHNFALLSLPIYLYIFLKHFKLQTSNFKLLPLFWLLGAAWYIYLALDHGIMNALVGGYGNEAMGLLPKRWLLVAFNYALVALSLIVPFVIWYLNRKSSTLKFTRSPLLALFLIHFVFFARYFIISQYTFALPTLFFVYLFLSKVDLKPNRAVALAIMQVVIPLFGYYLVRDFEIPSWYQRHKYRDEAAYFFLPWKFQDSSADCYAREIGGVWNGYP